MIPDAATTLEMMPWLEGLPPFVIRAVEITIAGGAAMTAIWLVGFIMCGLGVNIWVGMLMDGLRPRSDAQVQDAELLAVASGESRAGARPQLPAARRGGGW